MEGVRKTLDLRTSFKISIITAAAEARFWKLGTG